MISEPELVGGTGFPDGPPPGRPDVMGPPPPKPPRPRAPWRWALGGAAVASALWAGGLYAAFGTGDEMPDLGGYRTDRDPCAVAKLDGLRAALGPRDEDPRERHEPMKVVQPALFQWECTLNLKGKAGAYRVNINYVLHRVTDPGPEFEAVREDPQLGASDRVEGIGTRAYTGGALGEDSLSVLDGQAVITVIVESDDYDETGLPKEGPRLDPAALRTYLVEDTRQLMDALKR
jgi:hypothetical protein